MIIKRFLLFLYQWLIELLIKWAIIYLYILYNNNIRVFVVIILYIMMVPCVDVTYSPVDVISAIRGYVEHFLGCRECAVNFGHGASRMLSGQKSARYLTQHDGAVIWLWRSHNRANRHLRHDITEDPYYPKVQFPVAANCPACHRDSSWNEPAVLQYLVQYYGAGSVIDDDIDNGAGMILFHSASHSRHGAWLLHAVVLMLDLLLVVCV